MQHVYSIMGANPSSITIIKNAVPNDPQDFTFNTSGLPSASFNLDDDSTDATLPNSIEFSDLAAGEYSVTEVMPDGWYLDGISCNQGSNTSTDDKTVTINLSTGEDVTCTYTNRKAGTITVNKEIVSNNNFSPNFEVSISGTGGVIGDATDEVHPTAPVVFNVEQGTYDITETVPDGWILTDTDCEGVEVTFNNLNPSCTITNTKEAKITIIKDALPDHPQDFNFSFTAPEQDPVNFLLDDDDDDTLPNSQTFDGLLPGQYFIQENDIPEGWGINIASSHTCSSSGGATVGFSRDLARFTGQRHSWIRSNLYS